MRFISKQIVVSTVVNEEVTDNENIRPLIEKLAKANVFAKVEYRETGTDFPRSYDKAKFVAVGADDTVDMIAFKKTGQLRVNKLAFENLMLVEVESMKHTFDVGKDELTRYSFMDIGEEDQKDNDRIPK